MSTMQFRPAERKKTKLRMAIDGPAGSGKTFTALRFAFALGKRVAVIDSENESVAKYEGESPDGTPWKFDVLNLMDFAPTSYVAAIAAAVGRYDVLIIDSLSHAWAGKGGALELVDQKTKASNSKNAFTSGWRDVTPMHNQLVEAILRCPLHLICTMRSKMGYVIEGKTPVKVGLEPVQRQGMEYEFDILCDVDAAHGVTVTKSRCSVMADKYAMKPGPEFIGPLVHWLNEGADIPQELIDSAGFMERVSQPGANGSAVAAPTEPRKSVAELLAMQQQAASEPVSPTCTAEQSNRIHELFITLQIAHATQEKVLAKYGAQAARNLTSEQAAALISKLEAMPAKLPPAANSASDYDIVGEQLLADLKAEVAKLQALGDIATMKRIADKLGGRKIGQLCHRDAEALLQGLKLANLEAFFGRDLLGKDDQPKEFQKAPDAPFDS